MNLSRWKKAILHIGRITEIWKAIIFTKSWWGFTRRYIQLGNIEYPWLLETRDEQNIQLNNFHDLVTAWIIFCRQEYEVSKDAKVIIDLGANYGAFTLLAANQSRKSRIISLEPFPAMFERLQKNVASHGLQERVMCLPLAIAKSSGSRKMSLDKDIPDQSRGLIPENIAETKLSVSVKTISLHELLEYTLSKFTTEQIDIVKLDIEGGEHEWLPEIPASTLQCIRSWQMEYHPNGSKQELFQALERAGFICVRDSVMGLNSGVAYFQRQ